MNQLTDCLKGNPLGLLLRQDSLLRTEHTPREFYKDNFNFVEPAAVLLDCNTRQRKVFHYVPILKSVSALFKDKANTTVLKSDTFNT
jgi:hypothetical protein